MDAETQFEYADSLYKGGDYFLAVGEYKRFVFLFPGHARVEEAAFRVGLCLFSAAQYASAIDAFKELLQTYPGGRYAEKAQFRMSEAYLRSSQAGIAITVLRNLSIVTTDPGVRDEALYRMGWIHIEMAQWEQAQSTLAGISQDNRHIYRLDALARALDEAPEIKRKSPGLAGTLALVPGLGYLYGGRYQDALIAFLVNGGLIWAAYESFDNDLYALGSVITFVEIGFYAGNIYGSVSSAHKYNRKNERQWSDQLRKRLKVGLASNPHNKGIELSLRYMY
jgi:tetratricopeptide (TPR) repeat protein